MSVIGGDGGELGTLVQQLVMQIPAVTQVIFDGAAVVVNFNGMGGREQGAAIFNCVARP